MKPPEFTLSNNPMIDKQKDVYYIHHNKSPYFVARVFHLDNDDQESRNKLLKSTNHYGAVEYDPEYIIIIPQIIIPYPDDQQGADKLAKKLRFAAEWYKSLLIYEDSQKNIK